MPLAHQRAAHDIQGHVGQISLTVNNLVRVGVHALKIVVVRSEEEDAALLPGQRGWGMVEWAGTDLVRIAPPCWPRVLRLANDATRSQLILLFPRPTLATEHALSPGLEVHPSLGIGECCVLARDELSSPRGNRHALRMALLHEQEGENGEGNEEEDDHPSSSCQRR